MNSNFDQPLMTMSDPPPPFFSRGLLSGFMGGILGVILFYLVAVVATGVYSRDFLATLLAAAT